MHSNQSNSDEERLELALNDTLAIERTRLANQRTFLAFFRTGLSLIVTALAIFEFKYNEIDYVRAAYGLIILGGIIMLLGFINFFIIKRRIAKSYHNKKKDA